MSGQRKKRQASTSSQSQAETAVVDGHPDSAAEPAAEAVKAKPRAEGVKGSREAARMRYEKNQREMQLIRIGGGILAALLVFAIGYGVWNWADERAHSGPPEKTVLSYSYPGATHSNLPQTYSEHPPVGGTHWDRWQNCGYYDDFINSENAVHSLEHGAVWITFDPSLSESDRNRLKNLADEQDYILVSPMEDLPAPVVASSWNHQIHLTGADDPDLRKFIATYKQGPDTPEPGALCTRGTSDLRL